MIRLVQNTSSKSLNTTWFILHLSRQIYSIIFHHDNILIEMSEQPY